MSQPYPSEPEWWSPVFDVAVKARYASVGRPYPDPNDPQSLRWASRTAYDIAAGMTKDASLVKHLKELEDELGIVHPEPPPSPHPHSLVGRLRLESECYMDDAGLVAPVLCHAGDLIGQGLVLGVARILPALDAIRDAGYHGLRSWWCVWPAGPNSFWDPKPAPRWDGTRPESFDAFCAILKAGIDRGLVWHLAAGGLDAWTDSECEAKFDRLAEAIAVIGPDHVALCEGVNEARDTSGGRGPETIERFIQRVRTRFPQVIYALSAYTGHEDRAVLEEWTPAWMGQYLVHGWRGGHVRDKVRHIFSLGYSGEAPAVRRCGWQGEPTGPGHYVSATDFKEELDDEALALMAAMSAMARQAWNYMSSPGVIYADPDPFEAMPGFRSVPAMIHALPRDVMAYDQLAHGGDSWKNDRILAAQGEVRCDFARMHTDPRFMVVVYGPSGTYDVDVSQSFSGEIIHPGTGQREPISGHAGNKVRIAFQWGRVIVGRLT